MTASMFELAWVRFCVAGTLVTTFWAAELLARRVPRRVPAAATPRWVKPVILVSVLGFYALIGPTGGALFGGAGNVAGIALATLACFARLGQAVRYPDLGARSLFYLGWPLAVGAPWGLLVLSLPALATSLYCCIRAERLEPVAALERVRPQYRMFDRVW
jgi:hypothetical protein